MKKTLLPILFIGTVAMIIVMGKTGKPLKTTTTPMGILNLEFASNTAQVNNITAAWQHQKLFSKIEAAKANTYWDFVFILFYTGLLFLSCSKLSAMHAAGTVFNKAGKIISGMALSAGLLDVIENICMLQLLNGNVQNWLAATTTTCATLKFTFVIAAVIYILIALPLWAYNKYRHS